MWKHVFDHPSGLCYKCTTNHQHPRVLHWFDWIICEIFYSVIQVYRCLLTLFDPSRASCYDSTRRNTLTLRHSSLFFYEVFSFSTSYENPMELDGISELPSNWTFLIYLMLKNKTKAQYNLRKRTLDALFRYIVGKTCCVQMWILVEWMKEKHKHWHVVSAARQHQRGFCINKTTHYDFKPENANQNYSFYGFNSSVLFLRLLMNWRM